MTLEEAGQALDARIEWISPVYSAVLEPNSLNTCAKPRLFNRREYLRLMLDNDKRVREVQIKEMGPDKRTLWERLKDEYKYHVDKLDARLRPEKWSK
jgi:hypothetical protein